MPNATAIAAQDRPGGEARAASNHWRERVAMTALVKGYSMPGRLPTRTEREARMAGVQRVR